ncbi:hypothetical protein FJQ98_20535 [Lysinibacillus agricola]|uniref:Uncharacterized protein n=1 Tax=Lysinibacillus agricola TaxID=2590012 RepID=A0ABX7ANZ0_9BACI|nr:MULTISPECIES: hypothetical protein [Lysinibacillus]KOS60889.1 hypothetical protein AN161_20120 [Lysinibacillus sp. FJAT-14222]QQP11559.1 hypothetical protein FJQ98_20535 [Lysinibacillus agricola]
MKQSNSNQEKLYLTLVRVVNNQNAIDESIYKKTTPLIHTVLKSEIEIDYPAIFSMVIKNNLKSEEIEGILQILMTAANSIESGQEEIAEKIQKIARHFKLSFNQKEYFESLKVDYEKDLESKVGFYIGEVVNEMNKSKIKMIDDINESKKEVSKLYPQFITILGIFTAVVLSVFGGMTLLSESFSKINQVPIWKVVIISSIVALATLSMLFLLTRWVNVVISKSFNYDTEKDLMKVLSNNGAFTIGFVTFVYLIIAAVVFSSESNKQKLKSLTEVWDSWPIIIVLCIPLIIMVAMFLKILDDRVSK